MATFKFKFRKKDEAMHAGGWIALGDHFTDEDETILFSAECVNIKEVEFAVKCLKLELDDVLNKARSKFKKSQTRLQ